MINRPRNFSHQNLVPFGIYRISHTFCETPFYVFAHKMRTIIDSELVETILEIRGKWESYNRIL